MIRLLCLYSCVNNGIKPKVLDALKRDILQTYGYDKMFTLNNLEKAGLVKKADARNPYPQLRKAFRLSVDDIDEKEPNDIAYAYSGYAPLSVRLVQACFGKGGWRGQEDAMRLIPGPAFEEVQQLPAGLQPKSALWVI